MTINCYPQRQSYLAYLVWVDYCRLWSYWATVSGRNERVAKSVDSEANEGDSSACGWPTTALPI